MTQRLSEAQIELAQIERHCSGWTEAGHMRHFSISGVPRTKKTSNRIVQIKGKNGGRGFTKILPSEAHEQWFKEAMGQVPIIRRLVDPLGEGLLPLACPVAVRAIFFRDRLSGDLLGYLQALADWLQEPKIGPSGKMTRNGAGIIKDDAQIKSWDGSRLDKDATCPRIEVTIAWGASEGRVA